MQTLAIVNLVDEAVDRAARLVGVAVRATRLADRLARAIAGARPSAGKLCAAGTQSCTSVFRLDMDIRNLPLPGCTYPGNLGVARNLIASRRLSRRGPARGRRRRPLAPSCRDPAGVRRSRWSVQS